VLFLQLHPVSRDRPASQSDVDFAPPGATDLQTAGGGVPRHSLTVKYDYFYLDFDQGSLRYFSPANFKVHTPGVDWRYHASESFTAGLEAGIPMRVGGSTGYVAGGFFSWNASSTFSIEGRVRVVDDTQYHVTSFTLGPRVIF